MNDTHQQFWDEWAETYRGFSETVEPYREAQRALAASVVTGLGQDGRRDPLVLLDAGGGAGNLSEPLLEALRKQRGSLQGVTYLLTDSSPAMLALARQRLEMLARRHPDAQLRAVEADTLSAHFVERVGASEADLVVSSWNLEYLAPERRQELLSRLLGLAGERGLLACSSTMRLPHDLAIRDVLMPLGRAQVLHALIAGGPGRMRKVIGGLEQIASFGVAIGAGRFPEKPTLAELGELAVAAGAGAVSTVYQLYGASGIVLARAGAEPLPALAPTPIARILAGRPGYGADLQTIGFWGYLRRLFRPEAEGRWLTARAA